MVKNGEIFHKHFRKKRVPFVIENCQHLIFFYEPYFLLQTSQGRPRVGERKCCPAGEQRHGEMKWLVRRESLAEPGIEPPSLESSPSAISTRMSLWRSKNRNPIKHFLLEAGMRFQLSDTSKQQRFIVSKTSAPRPKVVSFYRFHPSPLLFLSHCCSSVAGHAGE